MLKIKNNVDLKELEKYGFEYKSVGLDYAYTNELKKGEYYSENIIVWPDKLIQCSGCIERLTLLYDLIKDGLVEKINETD